MDGTPVRDFHVQHSLNSDSGFVFNENGSQILYIDGASRENASLGWMKKPPKDNFERLSAISRFYQLKLMLAVEGFTRRKEQMIMGATAGIANPYPSPPPPDEKTKLKDLRKRVLGLQTLLRKAEKECENAKPQQTVAREAEEYSRVEECQAALVELRKIEI